MGELKPGMRPHPGVGIEVRWQFCYTDSIHQGPKGNRPKPQGALGMRGNKDRPGKDATGHGIGVVRFPAMDW